MQAEFRALPSHTRATWVSQLHHQTSVVMSAARAREIVLEAVADLESAAWRTRLRLPGRP